MFRGVLRRTDTARAFSPVPALVQLNTHVVRWFATAVPGYVSSQPPHQRRKSPIVRLRDKMINYNTVPDDNEFRRTVNASTHMCLNKKVDTGMLHNDILDVYTRVKLSRNSFCPSLATYLSLVRASRPHCLRQQSLGYARLWYNEMQELYPGQPSHPQDRKRRRRLDNMMIDICAKLGRVDDACAYFDNICGEPDAYSWCSLLDAQSRGGATLEVIRDTANRAEAAATAPLDQHWWSVLIDAYGHRGAPDQAMAVFDRINKQTGSEPPNAHHWAAAVEALARNGRPVHAMDLVRRMAADGVPRKAAKQGKPSVYVTILTLSKQVREECARRGQAHDEEDVLLDIALHVRSLVLELEHGGDAEHIATGRARYFLNEMLPHLYDWEAKADELLQGAEKMRRRKGSSKT